MIFVTGCSTTPESSNNIPSPSLKPDTTTPSNQFAIDNTLAFAFDKKWTLVQSEEPQKIILNFIPIDQILVQSCRYFRGTLKLKNGKWYGNSFEESNSNSCSATENTVTADLLTHLKNGFTLTQTQENQIQVNGESGVTYTFVTTPSPSKNAEMRWIELAAETIDCPNRAGIRCFQARPVTFNAQGEIVATGDWHNIEKIYGYPIEKHKGSIKMRVLFDPSINNPPTQERWFIDMLL